MANRSSNFILWILITVGMLGCSASPKYLTPLEHEESDKSQSITFVADPQIHNIYGLGLKQMSWISDIASKVAVRPPELNILAPLVLEDLLSNSNDQHRSNIIVVLGDTTNIACSGEYDAFLDALNKGNKSNLPVLMAHGNHDTYLMGTVNNYIPVDSQLDWKPTGMQSSPLPTDESWWGETTKISSTHGRNWRDGCFQPTLGGSSGSSPMNKSRWLAKYIAFLGKAGLTQDTNSLKRQLDDEKVSMSFSSKANSALKKLNFSAKGLWYRPDFGDVPSKSIFSRTYKSFLVQKTDFENTRMIIIDTSVCEKAIGGWRFIFTNAGQNACIGDPQFKIIEEYIASTPINHKLVLAGHFPLLDLSTRERNRLLRMSSTQDNWVYMSAHSHLPISLLDWEAGIEINVGSTTDWPMEANNVWFHAEKPVPAIATTLNRASDVIAYVSTNYNGKSEVCRHLEAAKKMALLEDYDDITKWRSPKINETCNVSDSDSWEQFGSVLADYVATVYERFHTDTKYRYAMLSIAAAASKSEFHKKDLVELMLQ